VDVKEDSWIMPSNGLLPMEDSNPKMITLIPLKMVTVNLMPRRFRSLFRAIRISVRMKTLLKTLLIILGLSLLELTRISFSSILEELPTRLFVVKHSLITVF